LNPGPTDLDPHDHAASLIPWYVNGTLAASEAAQLFAHLDACVQCRRDYEAQRRLHEAMRADTTLVFAAEPSFKKLLARIGTAEDAGVSATGGAPAATAAPVAAAPRARRVGWAGARWLAAAVVLEGLGLGYGAWAWHAQSSGLSASYATLTSPQHSYADGPRVRIVFRSGLSVHGLGVLLHAADAHIIDGPTDSNVYTLGFAESTLSPALVEQRVAALRADADVLFAEPLGVGNEAK
jgi:hypothetical protein